MTFEGVTGTYRNLITLRGSAFEVELFRLSTEPHDQERFRRRVAVPIDDQLIYMPTAEDVVITKLNWGEKGGRLKDRLDVKDVIAVQGSAALDWDYIYRWCDLHGTRGLLDEIRSEIPPDL
jgi:hypothetical protein